jgi:ribulose-phosphate 3-epimerase
MLKCDFGNLQREIALLDEAGAGVLHWDVMDGRFVPNLSYGAMVVRSCRPLTRCLFDAHLMIAEPERYVDEYLEAGCDAVTIHVEACADPSGLLRRIRTADAVAGLALNPGTPFEAVAPHLESADLVLVMSVEPGFGGQKFRPEVLEKTVRLRNAVGPERILSIDGGIGEGTIGRAAAAGADLFVAGSAVFDRPDYAAALASLAQSARVARGRSLEQVASP